jgi:hypothetical protein
MEIVERGRKAFGVLPSKIDNRPLGRMLGKDGKTVARWREDMMKVGAPPLMREDGSFTLKSHRRLDLVADAEPSWWNDDDLLEGFPHPEQVWRWWEEKESQPAQESTRQARHSGDEDQEPLSYAENPGGPRNRRGG